MPCSCSKWSSEPPAASSRCEALADYRLFVLASLEMKSWARSGKEELLAKTERLHDPFPSTLRPNRVHGSVILLDQMLKHLEGSEKHGEPCLVGLNNRLFPRMARLTSRTFTAAPEHVVNLQIKTQNKLIDSRLKTNLTFQFIFFGPSHVAQTWPTSEAC